jgi:copper chaperone CopZ
MLVGARQRGLKRKHARVSKERNDAGIYEMTKAELAEPVRYRVTGMDCPSCAAKIEAVARSVPGVQDARVSMASQEMTLRTSSYLTDRYSERKEAAQKLAERMRLDEAI